MYLAVVIFGVWGGLSNPKCLIPSYLEMMQPPKAQKNHRLPWVKVASRKESLWEFSLLTEFPLLCWYI